MQGIGLVTIAVGLRMTSDSANILIVMGSILLGGILGEWWQIENRLEALGDSLQERFHLCGSAPLSQGFVTASLIFCVGPLTILGSIRDGLMGDYSLLAIKSLLDGFTALALASSLGVGVLFSSITVLVFQGTLTLLASLAQVAMSEPMIAEMTAAGGVIIIGIGLVLLELKRVRIGSFLPAVFIAPAIVALLGALGLPIAP
jgi:uncharacterized membrane protein YqgA involved in biofilm formation